MFHEFIPDFVAQDTPSASPTGGGVTQTRPTSAASAASGQSAGSEARRQWNRWKRRSWGVHHRKKKGGISPLNNHQTPVNIPYTDGLVWG